MTSGKRIPGEGLACRPETTCSAGATEWLPELPRLEEHVATIRAPDGMVTGAAQKVDSAPPIWRNVRIIRIPDGPQSSDTAFGMFFLHGDVGHSAPLAEPDRWGTVRCVPGKNVDS